MSYRMFNYQYVFWITFTAIFLTSCQTSNELKPLVARLPAEIWGDAGVRSLAWAASRGDLVRIEKLYNDGVDINSSGFAGATPLWWPLQRQNKLGFTKLLELGADPNQPWEGGDTIMSWLVQLNDPFYFNQAINNGGNPHFVRERGNLTLLQMATYSPNVHIDIVKVLVDSGVDLNVQSPSSGITPVFSAVNRDRYDIAYLLLKAGANPTLQTANGTTLSMLMEIRKGFESDISGMSEWRVKVGKFLNKNEESAKASNP